MFRAAFPTAPDEAEKAEAVWIRSNYDLGAVAGASRLRLAGTWIPPDVATSLAEGYALEKILPPLASAVPDPNAEYRRSTRGGDLQGTPTKNSQNPPPGPGGPGNDGGAGAPNPSKRRKESSPAANDSANLAVLPTRRSGRAKSPAVVPTQTATITSTVTSTITASRIPTASPGRPKRGSARLANKPPTEPITPASSDANIGSEEAEEEVAEVPGPDPEADIQEQRNLINSLKAEQESSAEPRKVSVKRNREVTEEETPYKLQIKEPGPAINPETGAPREIRTNRRINLQPHQKSAAWGAFLFAAGFAAMSVLSSPRLLIIERLLMVHIPQGCSPVSARILCLTPPILY